VTPVERRLRHVLLALPAGAAVGTIGELVLSEHTEDPIQLVAFALCGVVLAAVGAFWLRPRRGTVRALRVAMVVVALGSLVGIVQHFAGNRALVLETQPNLPAGDVLRETLFGGVPLLAPGILALMAAMAWAATYRHPALAEP
jgi:hypothetical protein